MLKKYDVAQSTCEPQNTQRAQVWGQTAQGSSQRDIEGTQGDVEMPATANQRDERIF